MKNLKYEIRETGIFTNEIGELVAAFADFEIAKGFVDEMAATTAASYAVVENWKVIYPTENDL